MANYILALGGNARASASSVVEVFKVTANGVEKITDHGLSLSVARSDLAAASCGDYILSLGGYGSNNYYDTVDVFHVTSNGVEKITEHGLSLSVGRSNLAAASCGEYVLAMGGFPGSSSVVDLFKVTANGVEQVTGHGLALSSPRQRLAAASCGDYTLAMGGRHEGVAVDTVDVFKRVVAQ